MKICLLQPIIHLSGKGFQASHYEAQLFLHLSLRFEMLDLGFQVLQPCPHMRHARFKFLLLNQAVSITIDQPCEPAVQLPQLDFQAVVGIG